MKTGDAAQNGRVFLALTVAALLYVTATTGIGLLVSAFTFAVCFINPNAISMIYAISGPLIAMILFIMPTLSTWLIPALKPYRSVGNAITLVVGLLCVSVMFFG